MSRPLTTICPRGHEKNEVNLRASDRHCRLCDVERKRERRAQERILRLPTGPQPTHRRKSDGGIGGRAEARAIARMLARQRARRAA